MNDGSQLSRDILSDITVFMKYARYLPEFERRETWDELVDRNMSMHIQKYPQIKEEIEDVYNNFVRTKKVLPSMRALENTTPIITRSGWKTAGDVQVGDVLYSSEGRETKVISVAKFENKELFELTFSDGATLTACDEHLWIVSTLDDRREGKTRVVDTKFIRNHLTQGKGTYQKYNIAIWNPKPIEREFASLKIDPYVLGLWLGDGYSSGYQYSSSEEDFSHMSAAYETAGYLTKKSTSSNIWTWSVRGLRKDLKEYNLINNKHIPYDYLYASIPQRVELLAGLIDSDGCITKEGRVSFSNTSSVIISGVKELLSSLGISYIETIREAKDKRKEMYTLLFFTDIPVSKLPRKSQHIRNKNSQRCNHRVVTSVKSVGLGNATCFHVDSHDHSFLAGEQMIVTHNSMQFAGRAVELNNSRLYNCSYLPIKDVEAFAETMFLLLSGTGVGYSVQQHHVDQLPPIKHPSKTRRFLVDDSITGWADAIKVLMRAYLDPSKTTKPVFDFRDIRKKGARLITSGGKAPGPEPLKICLTKIESLLSEKEPGSNLTTLEAHDIQCHIADAVLSGGIRRAAMISLFSYGDNSMASCKSGAWWELNPQRGRANNSAVLLRHRMTKESFFETWDYMRQSGAGEPGFYFTNDKEIGTNPCAEISLKPYGFCNLTEINASNIVDQEDFNARAKAAAFMGTLQAGYTDFYYLRDEWRETAEKEALLGVSMTGIASGVVTNLNLREAASVTVSENERVSSLIGIRKSRRITTVKPSGTTSLVLGSSSGVHAWHNDYYLRRIRVNKNEAIYAYLAIFHPELIEDEFFSPDTTAVITIPQKAPENSITRHTESAIDLLNRAKQIHTDWIKPGHRKGDNTHNVSITVNIKEHEWDDVRDYIWENNDSFTAISCLPHSDHSYKQAPFEDTTAEMYNELIKTLSMVDLTRVIEPEDNTSLSDNLACYGQSCNLE
jgi:ribonucleoside-triphosphate reductase